MLWEYLVVDLTPADDWTTSLNTTLTRDGGNRWNTHKAILRRLSARGGVRS